MRLAKRSPLLVTTNKVSKTDESWTKKRVLIGLLVGLGCIGIIYAALSRMLWSGMSPLKEELKNQNHSDHQFKHLPNGLYSLGSIVDVTGRVRDLSEFAGNVSIVVNVASHCGYTKVNYEGLQKLYDQYKDQGFVILAFPCNQFGTQEPGNDSMIQKFTQEKFHVTFPVFTKIEVNGRQTHRVFTFLKENLPRGSSEEIPKSLFDLQWNFQKFLVGRNGMPIRLFNQEFHKEDIEAALLRVIHSEFKKS